MTRQKMARLRYLVALWACGSVVLAIVTAVCFRFGLDAAVSSFFYLTVIVLLSLLDSLISSLIFSVIAFICLDFFFTQPLFTFTIARLEDVQTLATFFLSSLVITSLVRKLHRATDMQNRQARQLDLTHDAIIASDTKNRIVYWNHGAEELYGWTRQEALGQEPQVLLQTEFPTSFEDVMGVLASAGRWEGELGHTRRDGTKVRVASRWSVQHDESGELIGRIVTNNDITERKRIEEGLRRSQAAFLAEAQQLSQTGSFGWNVATREVFWSDETFCIFGADPATRPSIDTVLRIVHPDDRARVRDVIERGSNGRGEIDFEHRLVMPNGAVKTVHVRARALNGKAEAATGPQCVGAVMDVTARTEAYAALQQSEARFRYLFDHMPVALVQLRTRGRARRGRIAARLRSEGVTDFSAYLDQHPDYERDALDGLTIEAMNDRATRMFGARNAGEMAEISNAWIWRGRPDTFRRILESRFRGEGTYQEETAIVARDGRVVDVLFTIARPEPGDSDTGLILYGFIDITESVRTREKLQNLQNEFTHAARLSLLGELTASIAHEVNQPLAAVAASGEAGLRWLDRAEPNVAEASVALRRVVADARRAGDIIARIRGMATRRGPQPVSLSLDEVVEEALLCLRHETQSKQVDVSLELAPALPPVLADRIQLQQVIVNLAVNAVQAMTQSGTANRVLAVSTSRFDGNTLTCTIEDSGPGIAEEHLEHLFESFFTTKDAGLGLGLAICRSIIERHGGNLRVDNGSAHGGARFSFTLPVAPAAP